MKLSRGSYQSPYWFEKKFDRKFELKLRTIFFRRRILKSDGYKHVLSSFNILLHMLAFVMHLLEPWLQEEALVSIKLP